MLFPPVKCQSLDSGGDPPVLWRPSALALCEYLCPSRRAWQRPTGWGVLRPCRCTTYHWSQLAPAQVGTGVWKASDASWKKCLGLGLFSQALKSSHPAPSGKYTIPAAGIVTNLEQTEWEVSIHRYPDSLRRFLRRPHTFVMLLQPILSWMSEFKQILPEYLVGFR